MILSLAVVALAFRETLERQCPECGRKQICPLNRINETLFCARCEAPILPKSKS